MVRSEVQPYFRAFMLKRGYMDSSEAPNGEYFFWIKGEWREFAKTTGQQSEDVSHNGYGAQFAKWLSDRALDWEARDYIEGGSC